MARLRPGEAASHFIHRQNSFDWNAGIHRVDDPVMESGVLLLAGQNKNNLRTEALRLAHFSPRSNAISLRLIAGRNAAGGVRLHRNNGNGLGAQFRPELLLDGGKIRVQIEVEPANRTRRGELHDFRLYEEKTNIIWATGTHFNGQFSAPQTQKARSEERAFENNAGDHLISHTLSRAVPSAQRGLTSVFGMGTGGTLAVWSPANLVGAWRAVFPAARSVARASSPGHKIRHSGATIERNRLAFLQGLLNVSCAASCAELILWSSRTGD